MRGPISGKLAAMLLAWAASLVAVFWVARTPSNPPGSNEIDLRSEAQEWKEIFEADRARPSGPRGDTCRNVDCGYHRLLSIWAAMDSTAERWAGGHYGAIELMNDPGKRRYRALLPVLKGALFGQDLAFDDYLGLRSGIAAQMPQSPPDQQLSFFLASVKEQQLGRSPQTGSDVSRFSLTNGMCRLAFIDYLRSGRHASQAEERWILTAGKAYSVLHPRP